MENGRHICNELKALRRRIAEENGIPLETEECTYRGECCGTCPRCDAEVRYLEDALSRRLTELTVQANREVRALGFKPFIAPALSSAALTVLGVIRGEWTDSSTYMGGLYFGCRNRLTAAGTERESYPDMPEALFLRIKASYERLDELASD